MRDEQAQADIPLVFRVTTTFMESNTFLMAGQNM
jgi:hypothetical protein